MKGEALTLVPLRSIYLVGVRVSEKILADLTVYDLPINRLPLRREVAHDWCAGGREIKMRNSVSPP